MLLVMASQLGMGAGGSQIATIDGADNLVLTLQYEGVTVYTDGTNWWIGV